MGRTRAGGAAGTDRPTLLLCTEHGYPVGVGPVAAWCEGLVERIPEVDVAVWSLTGHADARPAADLPPHVRQLILVPVALAPPPAGKEPAAPPSQALAALVRRLVAVVSARPVDVAALLDLLAEMRAHCDEHGADAAALAGDAEESLVVARLLAALSAPLPAADVVHAVGAGIAAVTGMVSAHLRGTPFVVTDHDVSLRDDLRALQLRGSSPAARRLAAMLLLAVARACYSVADHVVAACHDVVPWQVELGADPARIEVVYDGVDERAFAPLAVERSERPVVVQVAPITPAADTTTFVDVAARVHARLPDVRFRHYGPVVHDEYARAVFAQRDRLGLHDVVLFLGATPDPWLAYNEAHVVCLTAREAGFPFAAVQAMLCGRPVVASDAGGTREVLGRAGVVAPPGDADALADGVRLVLEIAPSVQAAMGAEGRERALAHFTLDRCVAAYRRVYDRLLRRGPVTSARAGADAPQPAGVTDRAAPDHGWHGALDSLDPSVRLAAVRRVDPGADPVETARLLERLVASDPDARVRAEAIDALASLVGPDAPRVDRSPP